MNAHGRTLRSSARPVKYPDGRDESLRGITYSTGQAKEVASAESAEEMKDTTDEQPWYPSFHGSQYRLQHLPDVFRNDFVTFHRGMDPVG